MLSSSKRLKKLEKMESRIDENQPIVIDIEYDFNENDHEYALFQARVKLGLISYKRKGKGYLDCWRRHGRKVCGFDYRRSETNYQGVWK